MAVSTHHLLSSLKVEAYDFDPGSTDAVDVKWVDMQEFSSFLCMFFRTVGTSALDTFKILANAQSDGGGTDVIIKTHAVATEPNAVGDWIFLECSAEEVGALGDSNSEDLRYVTASCEFATNSDEGVLIYVMGDAKFPRKDLSVDTIA